MSTTLDADARALDGAPEPTTHEKQAMLHLSNASHAAGGPDRGRGEGSIAYRVMLTFVVEATQLLPSLLSAATFPSSAQASTK